MVDRLPSMILTIAGMRDIVLHQTRQIDLCLDLLSRAQAGGPALPKGDPEVLRVTMTLIHMVGISGHSLLKLTDEISLGAKDAYPVARSIIEGAVNVGYLMASDPEVSKRAERHAEVNSYRDLRREWDVGGVRASVGFVGQLDPHHAQRLEAMMPEFLTARGREKDWTDLTLKQRLEATAIAFPATALLSLNVSAFNIYRHASEVIHGSYYGALLIWGTNTPGRRPRSSADLRLTLADHQFSALMSAVFAYAGMLECFSVYAGMPLFKADVDATLARIAKLPAIAEGMRKAPVPTGSPTGSWAGDVKRQTNKP